MIRRVVVTLLLSVAVAGCGGHGGARSVLPGTAGTTGGGTSVPKSSNVALFNGTLWYGAGASLFGVPLQPAGTGAELDGSLDGIVDPVPVAMTIAPDGTLYDLIADGETSWQLQAYAPGTFGAARPEEVIAGPGYPQQVVLVGDGIDVLSTEDFNTPQAASTLWTYAYGAGNRPQPIRTVHLGASVSDVASDNSDRIYVARRGGGITVYAAATTCACSPVRTIATGSRSNDAIAISRDGIVYVLSKDPNGGAVTIDAYAPGNGGPSPSRTIGPIAASRGTPTGGITVDSDGKVYVNFKDARNRSSVDVYAPSASGAGAPLNTIATPSQGGYVTAIAIGPLMQAPPPSSGVLYVGNGRLVNAFALGASGAASPQRSLTAVLGPDYPGGPSYLNAFATTTTTDGRLDVARGGGATPTVGTCSIAVEDPTANGSSGLDETLPCQPNGLLGLGRGPNGILDVATVTGSGSSTTTTITRYFGSNAQLVLPFAATLFTTDAQGDLYVAALDAVHEYAPDAVTGASPLRTVDLGSIFQNGLVPAALAAAADGTLYVLTRGDSPQTAVYVFTPDGRSTILWGPSGGTGTAIAVDAAGELFLGVSFGSGPSRTEVDVYRTNGMTRSLLNPVPAGTAITTLTVFE